MKLNNETRIRKLRWHDPSVDDVYCPIGQIAEQIVPKDESGKEK